MTPVCKICYTAYDRTQHQPMNIFPCGHGACQSCLANRSICHICEGPKQGISVNRELLAMITGTDNVRDQMPLSFFPAESKYFVVKKEETTTRNIGEHTLKKVAKVTMFVLGVIVMLYCVYSSGYSSGESVCTAEQTQLLNNYYAKQSELLNKCYAEKIALINDCSASQVQQIHS